MGRHKTGVIKTCEICTKEFYLINFRADKGKFCSRKCYKIGCQGINGSRWTGGRQTDGRGYIRIYQPTHPFCNKQGYVYEHRLVMEKHIGRYLKPTEIVHHINEIKYDSSINNLELIKSNSHHATLHKKHRKINTETGQFI